MNYSFLSKTILFRGTSEDEIKEMLQCLGAIEKSYKKSEKILMAGDTTESMGLVLSGRVFIENNDIWGNKSILSCVESGHIFAETYACIPGKPLMVNVIAAENADILFFNISRILNVCSNSCSHHSKLIKNLLIISAQKNLELSERILHTAPKSIRKRLLSYFSEQAIKNGSNSFSIPFNRQQLADYLGIDRSAMSNELSKMQKDGIIEYEKNHFTLL